MSSSRQRWLKVALVAYAPACATSLPSETPLGSGPLAGASAGASQSAAAPAPPDASTTEERVAAASAADASGAQSEPADAGTSTAERGPEAGAAEAGVRAAIAGTYAGKDRAIIRMSGKPEQTEDDPKARITVAEQGSDAVGITLINSADGTPICTLKAKLQGDRGEVTPGQPCFASGPGVKSVVQRGSATFAGKRLTVDLLIEMSVSAAGQSATGTIDYHFEGTRQ